MHTLRTYLLLSGLTLLLVGCGGGGGSDASTDSPSNSGNTTYQWQLPKDFPTPKADPDNPMSAAKIELGRHLFYDLRLSYNQTQACATCHQPALGFSDGLSTPQGSTGEQHPRHSMNLTNVVYNSAFNWANPNLPTLSLQAMVPLLGEFPVELGWSGHEEEMLQRLRSDPDYAQRFTQVFGTQSEAVTELNVARALAAFVATMISGDSLYDQAQRGEAKLSASAARGAELFFSEEVECFHCHGGFNFTQSVTTTTSHELEYHNNGLYNLDGNGAFPLDNRGLWDITHKPEDMGRFRAPTLRNVALNPPYMHDGSIASLEQVLDHYARAGRLISSGPNAGDGSLSPVKSEHVHGFQMNEQQRADLVAFLHSLTDWKFICDARFQDPFGHFPKHPQCGG